MTNVLIETETKLKMIVKTNTLTSKRKMSKTTDALGDAILTMLTILTVLAILTILTLFTILPISCGTVEAIWKQYMAWLIKSQKHYSLTHSLSNMYPRDASTSKNRNNVDASKRVQIASLLRTHTVDVQMRLKWLRGRNICQINVDARRMFVSTNNFWLKDLSLN